MKKRMFEKLEGESLEDKFASIGLNTEDKVDFRELKKINELYNIDVVLYFEEEIAKNSTYEADLKKYAGVPEYERPFVKLKSFMRFISECDPEFEPRLDIFPLMADIIKLGEHGGEGAGKKKVMVKVLLPFYNELDDWSAE
ncbi:MAG: hypothetical protein KAW93_06615 [Methanogenium sp.]|nr:hypothetical protein [Methanogenium sp.]